MKLCLAGGVTSMLPVILSLTGIFQVIVNFLVEKVQKWLLRSKVKVTLLNSGVHHNRYF